MKNLDYLNFRINNKVKKEYIKMRHDRESKELIHDKNFRKTKLGLISKFEEEVYEDKQVDDVVGIKPIDDDARQRRLFRK